MRLIEEARKDGFAASDEGTITSIVVVLVGFGANPALEILRMGRKLDRYRETARTKLEPWIVEAALARLDTPLTRRDQQTILEATRTPDKVKWPDWWSAH